MPVILKKKGKSKRVDSPKRRYRVIEDLLPLLAPIASLRLDPLNARRHSKGSVEAVSRSLDLYQQRKPIVVNSASGIVLAGNGTLEAARLLGWTHLAVVFVEDDPATATGYAIADNRTAELSSWDPHAVLELLKSFDDPNAIPGIDSGWQTSINILANPDAGVRGDPEKNAGVKRKLTDVFIVPPFSVLDGKQVYWRERRLLWDSLGLSVDGGSSLDAVGVEIIFRWFCPEGGSILDPLGARFLPGGVAGVLGYDYRGLAPAQSVATNCKSKAKALGLTTKGWRVGDPTKLKTLYGKDTQFDMVLLSPRATDLQAGTIEYPAYLEWFELVMDGAAALLGDNRFLVVHATEPRLVGGVLPNFLSDVVRAGTSRGLAYYNEMVVLPEKAGVDVSRFESHLESTKTHSSILVFWKGDPRKVRSTVSTTISTQIS